MKLRQLIDGSVASDFILIHDDKEARGELLLNEFIKQNITLQNNTNLLCLENNPAILKNLPTAVNFKNHCTSNHRQWIQCKSESRTKDDTNPIQVLEKMQDKSKLEGKNVIIIDSLSMLLLLYPDTCYKTIHWLVNSTVLPGKQQVISLIHNDVLPGGNKTSVMFRQLATTNLVIDQRNKTSCVTITHRKASGRIIKSVEQFFIDNNLRLVTKEFEKLDQSIEINSKSEWIKNDVTFKLELKDEEKHARSKLVLPYIKTSNQQSGGEITYEPDAGDDWDEEDPDDDLNI